MRTPSLIAALSAFAILGSALALADDAAPEFSDGWKYKDLSSRINPFFSEFKYFNFQDSGISGVMTYSVISPGIKRELALNAYFVEGGHVWSIQKTYPLSCVDASSSDVSADFCGEGGIEVPLWGPDEVRMHVRQDTGPIRWDLNFDTPMGEVTDELAHIKLDSRLPLSLDRLLVHWFMDWAPVLRSGHVTGAVQLAGQGRTFNVDTTTSYHDENWETWYPKSQPFNWLHFTGLDSSSERVDVTLVEFPFSRSKAVGLSVFSGGRRMYWDRGRYSLAKSGDGRVPITRRYGDNAEELREQDVDRAFSSGDHAIPTSYRITTDDDALQADFTVTAALSTAGQGPGHSSELLIDEQLLDARIRFVTPAGEVRTAAGPAEFMAPVTGP